MPLPQRPDLYLDETDPKIAIITGTDIVADPSWFSGKRKIIIRCTTLNLPESLVWHGGSIQISAHKLICDKDGSVIDVSGAKAANDFRPDQRAPSGATPGAEGGNGTNGGNGNDGGHVDIRVMAIEGALSVLAKGSQGGRPQSGGSGAKGRNAVAPSCPRNDSKPATNGGTQGKSGIPGNGGNGGNIVLSYQECSGPIPPLDASEGQSGPSGQHGKIAGQGGNSAASEKCYHSSFRNCSMTR